MSSQYILLQHHTSCRVHFITSAVLDEYFLWGSKSFTLPQPANPLFIKINLLHNSALKSTIPQTPYSSKINLFHKSALKSTIHVVVYADRLTTQHSIVNKLWSYRQFHIPSDKTNASGAAAAVPCTLNRLLLHTVSDGTITHLIVTGQCAPS